MCMSIMLNYFKFYNIVQYTTALHKGTKCVLPVMRVQQTVPGSPATIVTQRMQEAVPETKHKSRFKLCMGGSKCNNNKGM